MRNLTAIAVVSAFLALTGYMDKQDMDAEEAYRANHVTETQKDAVAMREYALCVQKRVC